MKKFNSAVLGIASAIGLTAALSKGFEMIKSSISSAMDRIDVMESFERVMTVLTGSAEKTAEALEATREAVTGTAYGMDVAAKSVQDFVTRGMEVSKATDTMKAWGDAVAFYGDGSNEQLAGVSDALAKMYSSGKVQMDQMNRLYDAGIDGVGMYAKATGQNVDGVQKALSSGKISAEEFIDVVTEAMMEGTNGVVNIAGAAKEAGASWGASFDNMKAAVTRGVVDIIETIDKLLEDNGLPSMRDMIADFGGKFESALKKVATFIEPIAKGFTKVYKAIKPLIPVIKSVAAAIGIAVLAVGGFLAVVGAVKLIGAAFMFLFSPIGLVIGGIAALVLGFQAAYKHSEPFRKAVDGVVGAFKGLFAIFSGDSQKGSDIMRAAGLNLEQINAVYDFAERVKTAFKAVRDTFAVVGALFSGDSQKASDIMRASGLDIEQIRSVFDFTNGLKAAFERVGEVFSGIGTLLSGGGATDLLTTLGFSPETIASILGFVDTIKTGVGEFVSHLKEKWAEIQPGLATLFAAFVTAKDVIVEVFTSLLSYIQPVISGLVTAFKIVADVAVMVFNNIIAPAIGFLISMFQVAWKVIGPILELLGTAMGLAFGILKVVWDTILKPVAAWLTGAFATSFEAAKPYVESMGTAFDKFGGFVSGITDKLKTFSTFLKGIKIPAWVTDIGGKIAGAASYVGNLVSGDDAKSNYHGNDRIPYDGYLARMHKGERILTRQDADAMDHISYEGASGGATYNNSTTYNNVSTTQASASKQGAGGGVTITGNTFNVRQESDIDSIADQLYRKINAALEGGA